MTRPLDRTLTAHCATASQTVLFVLLSLVCAAGAWAANINTRLGPAVAISSTGNVHLFFTGHNNDYVWETSYSPTTGTWTDRGRILNSANQAARTTERPVPLTINNVFFHGNIANDYAWNVSRSSSAREWGRPYDLKYSESTGTRATERFLLRSSPAVLTYSWPGRLNTQTLFYTDLASRRISFTTRNDPELSAWSRPSQLPAACVSNVGPAIANVGGSPLVFYAKRDTSEIFMAAKAGSLSTRDEDDWTIVGIPRAFTTLQPAARNIEDGILLAYKGHNNKRIWLRLYRRSFGNIMESSSWRRLGYVADLETDQAPALAYRDGNIVLAFKVPDVSVASPRFDVDIGYLTLDEANRHDTPGHSFTSFR